MHAKHNQVCNAVSTWPESLIKQWTVLRYQLLLQDTPKTSHPVPRHKNTCKLLYINGLYGTDVPNRASGPFLVDAHAACGPDDCCSGSWLQCKTMEVGQNI